MSVTSAFTSLRRWLALERNIIVMLIATVALGLGEELWSRFFPSYLEALSASAWMIASYGALKDFLDAVYQYPGGWMADKIGRRLSLALFTILAVIGYCIYLWTHTWLWALIGTVFVMCWSSFSLPAVFAVIGDTLSQSRRATGFSVQSIIKRVPIVLGPPIGGALIAWYGFEHGMKYGFAVSIALAIIALVVILRYYNDTHITVADGLSFRGVWRAMDAKLKKLLVADILARWAEGIPKVFIPLYVLNHLHATAFTLGWLTSVQMLTSIALYLPVAKLADKFNRAPFVLLTLIFFAVFPLSLVWGDATWMLVLAFVLAGLREIGEPARKALIVDLASHSARGRAVGVYYFLRGMAVFPAAIVGGWLWSVDIRYPFIVAFVVGVGGAGAFALLSYGATRGHAKSV